MKKVAIGCAVLLVLAGVAAGGIGYYSYLKIKSTVAQLAELRQVSDIERGVKNTTPFVAPESHALTATQVERLVQVQTRVHDRLGASAAAIQSKYQALLDKKDNDVTDLPALLSAYKDLARTVIDAKHAQVEALNNAGMSLEEYRWIRSEAYRALGVPFVDMDMAQMVERAKNGQAATATMGGTLTGTAPPSNVKLVEKYRKQLEDYVPLASFGL